MERPQVRMNEITGEIVKVEVTGWWTGSGGCVLWPLRVVVCLKTGDLL